MFNLNFTLKMVITRVMERKEEQAMKSMQGMADFKVYMNIVRLYLSKNYIMFMGY